MITHVVLFKWMAGTTDADVGKVATALDGLAAALDLVIRHGPDLQFRDTNSDYGLIATFADRAAWTAYQQDARHKAVVESFIAPHQASRVSVQFADGEGA